MMTYWLNFVLKQYPDIETWVAIKNIRKILKPDKSCQV